MDGEEQSGRNVPLAEVSEKGGQLLEPMTNAQDRLGSAGRITIDLRVRDEKMERWAGGHHSGRGLGAPPLNRSMHATSKIIYSAHEREKLGMDRVLRQSCADVERKA
eukprot:3164430-Prymnesium_polylepis.1